MVYSLSNNHCRIIDEIETVLRSQSGKSNLDEWKYTNYTYPPGSDYLCDAGLDSDYEAHQVFITTTFHF